MEYWLCVLQDIFWGFLVLGDSGEKRSIGLQVECIHPSTSSEALYGSSFGHRSRVVGVPSCYPPWPEALSLVPKWAVKSGLLPVNSVWFSHLPYAPPYSGFTPPSPLAVSSLFCLVPGQSPSFFTSSAKTLSFNCRLAYHFVPPPHFVPCHMDSHKWPLEKILTEHMIMTTCAQVDLALLVQA